MAGGTNWESTETWQRVVAAIIASGVKLDLKTIATYYGTTYDTLENRFRKIKKDAAVLKKEVDDGERGEVAPRATKSNPVTPRKPKTPKKDALTSVTNGRVNKASPTKKKSIKQEQLESSASIFDDLTDSNHGSFAQSGMGSFEAETTGMFDGGMDF